MSLQESSSKQSKDYPLVYVKIDTGEIVKARRVFQDYEVFIPSEEKAYRISGNQMRKNFKCDNKTTKRNLVARHNGSFKKVSRKNARV